MSIRMINNTQKPFVVVNKAIAMDKDLNMRDRGMMLTLMSFPPEWKFSIKGLEKIVPDGRDAINSSLQRLEEKRYLVRVQERDEKGKFTDTKIYINPNPKENPVMNNPIAGNPTSAKPPPEKPNQIINKEKSNQQLKNEESINHSPEYIKTLEVVKDRINYDTIAIDRPKNIFLLNYIVELIAGVFMSNKTTIRIAGADIPTECVRDKIKRLSMFNVEFVIDRINEVSTKITDFDSYLLTCLYKAEEQEDMYWNNMVKNQKRQEEEENGNRKR